MRNRQRCEANRKERLLNAAEEAFKLTPKWRRDRAIKQLRLSHDWKQATRVTRGIVDEFIAVWDYGEEQEVQPVGTETGTRFDSFEV